MSVGYPRMPHGLFAVCPRIIRGIPADYPRTVNGLVADMDCPRTIHFLSVGHP